MIPGNREPARYRSRTFISLALGALLAAGATAPQIYDQVIREKEGDGRKHTVAYLDGAGIWTICGGLTRIYGRKVVKGDRLTPDECARLDREEQARGLEEMRAMLGDEIWNSLSPAAQAGLTSWCIHNLGAEKCEPSTAIRRLREGDRNGACAAITLWIRDGGKDCRDRRNGCLGQVSRRQLEDELCLVGSAS